MATFEELAHNLTVLTVALAVDFRNARYDDALGVIDDLRSDLEKTDKIVRQRFTMQKVTDLLKRLDRIWPDDPETADRETLEECGALADQITDIMKQLARG